MTSALLLTDKFLPQPGGSQLYLGRVFQHLRGTRASVLTRSAPGAEAFDRAYPLPVRRLPFINIPKARMPLLWAGLLAGAALRVLARGTSEIHCGQVLETGLSGWLLRRAAGCPYCLFTYGEELQVYGGTPAGRRWLARVLGGALAVVTISRASREMLLSLGAAEEKIAIAYPGVDTPRTAMPADALRRKHGLGDGPVLLTVGRLAERKGQDTVIRALPRLAREYPGIRYVVAGQGPYQSHLRRLADEASVADRVLFLTGVSDGERGALYAACDLFVMPNRRLANGDTEGFGIVFLEAGLAGRAVIAGRDGGSVEAVEDGVTGVLADGASTEGVAEAVLSLLRDPERRRAMGEAGRARAMGFTWEATAQAVDRHLAQMRGEPAS